MMEEKMYSPLNFYLRDNDNQDIPQEEPLPETHPDDLIDNMESELFPRLDRNLSDYCEKLMDVDKTELIGMSEEIAARFAVRDYLKGTHHFNVPELDFLLGLNNPLEVICEHTPPIPTLLEMSGALHDISAIEDALNDHKRQPDRSAAIETVTQAEQSKNTRDELLAGIAKEHCHIDTLETRKSDRLDFHEVPVWSMKAALEAAFEAGIEHQLAKDEMRNTQNQAVCKENTTEQLVSRLDKNLDDMMPDLRQSLVGPDLSSNELVEMADRITTIYAAHVYFTEHDLQQEYVDYLIQFQNPLEVLADRWPSTLDGAVDMDSVMLKVYDKEHLLQGVYPLMADAPAAKERLAEKSIDKKPSLLAEIRKMQSNAKAEQHPGSPKPTKSEPAL